MWIILFALIFQIDAKGYTPNLVSIGEKTSFMQYVHFDSKETVTACQLDYIHPDEKIISLVVPLQQLMEEQDEIFGKRLTNIRRGICGIKIDYFSKHDPNNFTFIVNFTDVEGLNSISRHPFIVSVNDIITSNNIKIVKLGGEVVIDCGITHTQLVCRVLNPKNELVQMVKDCKYEVKEISYNDIGRWTCIASLNSNMEEVPEYTYLQLDESEKVNTWYKEENGFGILGCNYENHIILTAPADKYCQLVRPDKRLLTISVGSATDRYTTLGTNLTKFTCQIEFPLPLLTSEIGLWECRTFKTGGFIQVNSKQIPEYTKYTKKVVKLGLPFDVSCKVPFASNACFIESPNGTVHNAGVYTDFWLGKCGIKIETSYEYHYGKWKCRYSHPKNAADENIVIEVTRADEMKAAAYEIIAEETTEATLLCRSGTPIHYCRFVSPSGTTYHASAKKPKGEINYFGNGFDSGECGINIVSVQKEHDGLWSCYVRTGQETDLNAEFLTEMKLVVVELGLLSTSAMIGIPMAVAVILLFGVASIVYYMHKTKTKRNSSGNENNRSEEESVSNEVTSEIGSNQECNSQSSDSIESFNVN